MTAGLPDSPKEFQDMKAPDGLASLSEQGSSEALGRIILVFSTENERNLYCDLLGLDREKATKQTWAFSEVPAVNHKTNRNSKKKLALRKNRR
jgi:hypothetical protein